MQFLILLSLLFQANSIAYTQGTRVIDLFLADGQDSGWSLSGFNGPSINTCAGSIVVGVNVNPGASMSTSYTVAPHNSILFLVSIWLLDSVDQDDFVRISINGVEDVDIKTGFACCTVQSTLSNLCGQSTGDIGHTRVMIRAPHTNTTITVKITGHFGQSSSDEGFAVHALSIQAYNASAPFEVAYYNPNTALASYTRYTYTGMNYWPDCTSNCYYCYGSAVNNCLLCKDNNSYFEGDQCFPCPVSDTCLHCGGPTTCVTYRCPYGEYYYSNTSCIATCNYPFTVQTVTLGNPKCNFMCGSDYLYANGTCKSSCPSPFVSRTEGTYKYCDEAPCYATTTLTRTYYLFGYCYSKPVNFNEILGCQPFCSACASAANCTSCIFPAKMNGTMCYSFSYLTLTLNKHVDAVAIYLNANISFEEIAANPSISFTWSVTTNSTSTALLTSLQAYLSSLHTASISVAFSYFDPDTTYLFQCSYTNAISVVITNTTSLDSLSCFSSESCILCSNSTTCVRNKCSGSDYYYTGNKTCKSSCSYPFTGSTLYIGSPRCNFICGSDFLVENGTCVASCPSPYVTRIEGAYRYCDENPCRDTVNQTGKYYESPYCLDCPENCTTCLSPSVCTSCIANAEIVGSMCSCIADYHLNASKMCQPDWIECYMDSHCTSPKPHCNLVQYKCKECLVDSHCSALNGEIRFCSNGFTCIKEPKIDLQGPAIISAEFDIQIFYILQTDASSYMVKWSAISSSSDSAKLKALSNFLLNTTKPYVTVPYHLLEKGAEYNFTISYNDSFGYSKNSSRHILPSCPREKYLIIGRGCAGNCTRGCFECDNPITCITCAPFAVLNSTTLRCDMFSFITIGTADILSPKSVNTIFATIAQEELGFFQISYKWTLTPLTESIWTNTSTYLATQNKYKLSLPGGFLKPVSSYQLHCSYINYIGQNISTYANILVASGKLLVLQVDGSTPQILQRNIRNQIKLFSPDPSEYDLSMVSFWTKVSGPILTAEIPAASQPLEMTIPACSFKEGSTYKFKINFSGKSFDTMNAIDFTAITRNDSFSVEILNGNRTHAGGTSLRLESLVKFDNYCPDSHESYTSYLWICKNLTNLNRDCNDGAGVFGVTSNYYFIQIPSYYFEINQTYGFYVQAIRASKTSKSYTEITIGSPSTLSLQFQCQSSPCSKYYTLDLPLVLYTNITGVSDYDALQYEWKISPNLSFVTLKNKFFLFQNASNPSGNTLKITIKAYNSTHQGEAFTTFRYNTAPTQGQLNITPSQGEALSTYFTLASTDWLDEDSPLTYQYFYSFNTTREFRSLSEPKLYSDLITYLPASSTTNFITIKVIVTDFYSASSSLTSTATVSYANSTFENLQEKIESILTSVPSYSPSEVAKSITLISSQLQILESRVSTSGCPFCSNHGFCAEKKTSCTCDAGWAGPGCSLSNSTMRGIVETKVNLLRQFDEKFNNGSENGLKSMVISALSDLTKNVAFNNKTTITATEEIMEKKLILLSPTTELSRTEKNELANVLSNLVQFKSSTDCNCSSDSCQKYATKLNQYFDVISSSAITIPNLASPLTDFSNDIYDLILGQFSLCDIEKQEFFGKVSTQRLKLLRKDQTSSPDCSQIAAVKTFAIQDKEVLFNCNAISEKKTKSKLGVCVTLMGSQQDITDEYTVIIKSPLTETCPLECSSSQQLGVLYCQCPKKQQFDPAKQIQSIFQASEIEYILDLGSLSGWNPLLSPVFWTDLVLVAWFVWTYALLGTKKLGSSSIEYLLENNPTTKRVVLYNFLVKIDLFCDERAKMRSYLFTSIKEKSLSG